MYQLQKLNPLQKTLSPVSHGGNIVTLPEKNSPYRGGVAMYRAQLLSFGPSKGLLQFNFYSTPWRTGGKKWFYSFADGFGHRGLFYDWKRFNPEISSFHWLRDRYIPLCLRRIKKGNKFKIAYTKAHPWIFDFFWESFELFLKN